MIGIDANCVSEDMEPINPTITHIKILQWKDDGILLADNEDDLERLSHVFSTTAKKCRIKIFPMRTYIKTLR